MPRSADLSSSAADPLITIAIPTYNRASWLKGCIEAALAQTYANFEIVVSDNASTDETSEAVKAFGDPRLRLVKQERNIGMLPNWNACLAAAKGQYIFIVPDDDRIYPQLLERCAALVRQDPTLPLVVTLSDVLLADEQRIIGASASPALATGIHDGSDVLIENFRHRITVRMCGVMMRTDTLRAQGGVPLDLPHAADVACWYPMLLTGKTGLVNEACSRFIAHDESETARLSFDIRVNDFRKVIEQVIALADARVKDARKRRAVKSQARLFLAFFPVYQKIPAKAGLAETLAVVWGCRQALLGAGWDNGLNVARSLAYLLLPSQATDALRSSVRMLRQLMPARQSSGGY